MSGFFALPYHIKYCVCVCVCACVCVYMLGIAAILSVRNTSTVLIHTAVSTSHKVGCYDTCGYTHVQITLWQLPNYMVA